ncbi:hypothetical protein AN958_03417 [Leucoagaricus sp. SymC.cos]|nr:hypothetical protein AN958_03417 [Leucoagaricus sp. SymC.cos]
MTIPAITMVGTCPIFYKIPVTQALSKAVSSSLSPQVVPSMETIVHRCTLNREPLVRDHGLYFLEYRAEIMKYYEAFRKVAKHHWEDYII